MAVPINDLRASGSNSRSSLCMRNSTMIMEPENTISCANGTLPTPIAKVKEANTKLPPKIHQFGLVSVSGTNSALSMVVLSTPWDVFNKKACFLNRRRFSNRFT